MVQMFSIKLFPCHNNRILLFLLSKSAILKPRLEYGQYGTPLDKSDCRYFVVSDNYQLSHGSE